MTDKLTPQRQAFCREYRVDRNGTKAAIRAHYSEKSARSKASQLLKVPAIQARIAELEAGDAERNDISVDSVAMNLVTLRKGAEEKGQFAAAVQAEMGRAKLGGLLIDRVRDESAELNDKDVVRNLCHGDEGVEYILLEAMRGNLQPIRTLLNNAPRHVLRQIGITDEPQLKIVT